jgi:hypothetical protein
LSVFGPFPILCHLCEQRTLAYWSVAIHQVHAPTRAPGSGNQSRSHVRSYVGWALVQDGTPICLTDAGKRLVEARERRTAVGSSHAYFANAA